jgi:hypothetical protein
MALPLCARESPVLKPRLRDGRVVACHVAQDEAAPLRQAA